MTLADFTNPGLIAPRLAGRDAAGVLQELSLLLHQSGYVPDWLPVCNDALNHQFLLSTDPTSSLVFPYAHLPGIKQPVFAFGRSDHPVDRRPKRIVPVRLVLLIAVPAMDSSDYFHLTSGLIQLAGHARQLRRILAADDAPAIHAIFAEFDVRDRQAAVSVSSPISRCPGAS